MGTFPAARRVAMVDDHPRLEPIVRPLLVLLRILAWLFLVTAAAELVAMRFTSIGIAGLFAATFGFFFGGLFLALAQLLEDVRAVRNALEGREGARAG